MNVQADSLASQYLQGQPTTATGGPRRASRHFPTMYASLLIEDRRIHSFTSAQIRSHIKQGHHYRTSYFGKKHKIDHLAESYIEWRSLKSAVKKQTTGMKTMITKYIHGWLPTGTRRILIHNGEVDSCPQCGCQATNEHIVTCGSCGSPRPPTSARWPPFPRGRRH